MNLEFTILFSQKGTPNRSSQVSINLKKTFDGANDDEETLVPDQSTAYQSALEDLPVMIFF